MIPQSCFHVKLHSTVQVVIAVIVKVTPLTSLVVLVLTAVMH